MWLWHAWFSCGVSSFSSLFANMINRKLLLYRWKIILICILHYIREWISCGEIRAIANDPFFVSRCDYRINSIAKWANEIKTTHINRYTNESTKKYWCITVIGNGFSESSNLVLVLKNFEIIEFLAFVFLLKNSTISLSV